MSAALTLNKRLAQLILMGAEFTTDDLTNNGQITLDGGGHTANSRQNGIGAFIRGAANRGLIRWTGDVDTSRSPHRKGGMVRVWTGTTRGKAWAVDQLEGETEERTTA